MRTIRTFLIRAVTLVAVSLSSCFGVFDQACRYRCTFRESGCSGLIESESQCLDFAIERCGGASRVRDYSFDFECIACEKRVCGGDDW